MHQRLSVGLVLLVCSSLAAFAANKPWLIVNEDNDHYFKQKLMGTGPSLVLS